MGTHGGLMGTKQMCKVPELGEHWFNENWIKNIISLAHMANKYQVTYNSEKERAFNVHIQDNTFKFKEKVNGLYAIYPNSK